MPHAKITISLPSELLEAAKRLQAQKGECRSALIREALEAYVRQERERADVERYVRGYMLLPESDDEVEVTDRLAVEAAESEPWQ